MHLISFDASPRQLSKLRNGHKVRVKRGTGFNLVVNPQNYHLVTRAFTKNKALDLALSPEEIQHNKEMSPEQHEELADTVDENLFNHLPFAEGGSIFKKGHKASKSKHGKAFRQALKPAGREFLKAGQEAAHNRLAEAHMNAASNTENEHMRNALNSLASSGHESIYNVGKKQPTGGALFKFLGNKKVKGIRRALKPAGRAFYDMGKDLAHDQLAQLQMAGADYVPDNPNAQMGYNMLAQSGHDAIGYNRPRYNTMPYQQPVSRGYGLGAGMSDNLSGYDALRYANLATAQANHKRAIHHNDTVHGQITQPTLRRYWDGPMDPPSRGSGVVQMQGRGALLNTHIPTALQSQPFGANFHMQFFLPPEYRKYNDGTSYEGRGAGLYV